MRTRTRDWTAAGVGATLGLAAASYLLFRRRPRAAHWTGAALALALAARSVACRLNALDLRDRVAIITGGTRGFGLALARELVREGARVVICARDREEIEAACRELATQGAEVLGVACDVTRRDQVDGLVQATLERFGRIDVLVNNAGTIAVGPVESFGVEDFIQALNVYAVAMVNTCLAVLPEMLRRGGGNIVNVTSIGGVVSVPHLLPYGTAKFATVGLSDGLRSELARHGVTVTTVIPGLMRTGSYVQGRFRGDSRREYAWFAVGSSLPGLAMDPARAARQAIRSVRLGRPRCVLGLPAKILERMSAILPATTARVLASAARLLPRHDGTRSEASGFDLEREQAAGLVAALTHPGRTAGERFHQREGGGSGSPSGSSDRGLRRN